MEPRQDSLLVLAIKLGGQVIQSDHRPFATLFCEVLCLGQQAGKRSQLGLPA
jgi:hypothetical protein